MGGPQLITDCDFADSSGSSPFPSEIGIFSNLRKISLTGYAFAGKIVCRKKSCPIGVCVKAATIVVKHGTGPLPTELGLLIKIRSIRLNRAALTGAILTFRFAE